MIKNVKSLVRVKKTVTGIAIKKQIWNRTSMIKNVKSLVRVKKNSNWDSYKKIDLEQDQHEKR